MNNTRIPDPPTESEQAAVRSEFLDKFRATNVSRRTAAIHAREAMHRLAKILCDRSGQPFHLRGLLYSLWNGQPVNLSDVLLLDFNIRKDLCAVILGFGYECGSSADFFYKDLQNAITTQGQWDWFLEAYIEKP